MDYYFDLRARALVEMTPAAILSSVVGMLHRELVSSGTVTTGISFPNAEPGLGDVLRVHDDETALDAHRQSPWTGLMSDYVEVGPIREVPERHDWIRLRRVQPRLSAARIRRAVARQSMTVAEAEAALARRPELTEPYVQLRSSSTGQKFRLFFRQEACAAPSVRPVFNAYGLGGAIPSF